MAQAAEGIDIKGAVKRASTYLEQLYDKQQLQDVLLEEVRRSDDDRYWLVTMGFSRPVPGTLFEQMAGGSMKREYKIFEIDSGNGEVRSMRIREA